MNEFAYNLILENKFKKFFPFSSVRKKKKKKEVNTRDRGSP